MVQSDGLVDRGIVVSLHKFEWFDPYLYCGCTTLSDTPIFIVLVCKGDRAFSNGME